MADIDTFLKTLLKLEEGWFNRLNHYKYND